jgi:hypothetical protein
MTGTAIGIGAEMPPTMSTSSGLPRLLGERGACSRHCEERSDEAIQTETPLMDCFASLAMTICKRTLI